MTTYIDPTAQVSPKAIIRPGAWIGPNCVVEEDVVVGNYSVIGGSPEHGEFYEDVDQKSSKGVFLAKGSRIFEFVTIHAGTIRPTYVGPGTSVFQHSHVSHDCHLERGATVCGRGSIAGFVHLMEKSMVGAHAIIHQHCVVGAYGMVGMSSSLKAHVPPGQTWMGCPAKQIGWNWVGLNRVGMTQQSCVQMYALGYETLTGRSRL